MIKREDLDCANILDRQLRYCETVHEHLVHYETVVNGGNVDITIRGVATSSTLDTRIKTKFLVAAIESEINDIKRELASLGVWMYGESQG